MNHRWTAGAAWALVFSLFFVASSCSKGAESAAAPVKPARKSTIGLVFDVGDRNDMSFNQSAYEGLRILARDVGGRIAGDPDADYGDVVDIRVLDSKVGGADREQLLRSLAEEGRELIFAMGFLFADSIRSVSRDYPRSHFVLIDGAVPDLNARSNVTCVSFAEHEGSFLVGAYAGLLAAAQGPDARVGFVGGMDTPVIRHFLSGFSAGAAWANPELRRAGRIMSGFVARDASGFDDPKRAGEFASIFCMTNVKVIYAAAGGSNRGVFETAARFGVQAIGADTDQAALFSASDSQSDRLMAKSIATSMLKRVDLAVYTIGYELIAGAPLAGGYRTMGLSEGGVGYVAHGLSPDHVTVLSDLSKRIAAGDIVVPDSEDALSDFLDNL